MRYPPQLLKHQPHSLNSVAFCFRRYLPGQIYRQQLRIRTFTTSVPRMVQIVASTKDFKDSIKNGLSVVDFYAVWCGPCKVHSRAMLGISVIPVRFALSFWSLSSSANVSRWLHRNLTSFPSTILARVTSKLMLTNSLTSRRSTASVPCPHSCFSRMGKRSMNLLVQIQKFWKRRSRSSWANREGVYMIFAVMFAMNGLEVSQ